MATQALFLEDPFLKHIDACVLDINDRGGIILDRTIFYATSGGQPGDVGSLSIDSGATIDIGATIYDAEKSEIIHVPAGQGALPAPGDRVTLSVDWPRRLRHMRMHTALHLLCSLVPYPVTGGSIGEAESRLDFDIEDAGAIDKDTLTEEMNALISTGHPVKSRWISDDELAANPDLVRTMSVKPPTGSGSVRLIAIGNDEEIDLQPCGGTHVGNTSDIGPVLVSKIEKKGRQNRRIRVRLAEIRMTRPLVDVGWLHDNLDRDNVVVVDASWYLPNRNRDGYAEYLDAHIPGAVYFPIDDIADKTSRLPHMLPGEDEFAASAGAMGISDSDTIVVYDAAGLSSSARVWWTFRVFGAENVVILDGGLPAWKDAGYEIGAGEVSRPARSFNAKLNRAAVSDFARVKQALQSGARQVLDARSAGRFAGSAPEPRPELPSGHMPGSFNLPFTELIGPDGKLLPDAELRRRLESAGIDLDRPVTTTCGSGVTAAILTLALESIGHDDLSLYDGSWTEWASRGDCPIDTGTQ